MIIPVACISYHIDQNSPSPPFVAYIDSDDPIRGLASIAADEDYYPGVDQTTTIKDHRSFVLHTPADPNDADDEPYDDEVICETSRFYGDIALETSEDCWIFVGLPRTNDDERALRVQILRRLGIGIDRNGETIELRSDGQPLFDDQRDS